jgi:hypothetical protein
VNDNDFTCIAELSVITDAQAAGLVSDSTHANMVAAITASPFQPANRIRRTRRPSRAATRLRLAVALPVAVGVAVAVLVATSAGRPGQHVGPVYIGPAKAQALTFTKSGRYIKVIVRDPLADERKYNAEFKAHGLHITLSLVPASPSLVGTLVYADSGPTITPITAKGKCWTGGGGSQCPVGLLVPVDYRGVANIVFGRAARPGERYETTVPATTRGESLYGLDIAGRRLSAVLAMVRERHVSVAEYQFMTPRRGGVLARHVPLNWFVYNADPWAPGQVLLFVGKTRHQVYYAGHRVAGAPSPTPSPGR